MVSYTKDMFKNNPTYGISLYKKTLAAFKKKYISIGLTTEMATKTVNSLHSLSEGHRLRKDSLTAMVNSTRAGSSYRALATISAGVMTKHMVLATQSFMVSSKDCGTNKRYSVILGEHNKKAIYSITTYYKSKLIDKDKLDSYIGKVVEIRTPMTCKEKGDNICEVCAGDNLSVNKGGIPHMTIDTSGNILYFMLSKFHNTDYVLKTFTIDMAKR